MDNLYLWLKALHIIAVISWMAGLFYLPRLFVYHSREAVGSAQSETFKTMERKLLRIIMTPAMVASWLLGLLLIFGFGLWQTSDWWLFLKIIFVLALSGFHGSCARWVREFEQDRNSRSERFYRLINEVPTILMILIVITVVTKPF